jgi:hypothetical protein
MRQILGAALLSVVLAVPAHAEDPQRGIELGAVAGGAQATIETVRGFAVTADCKVFGFVSPNREVDLVLVGRAVGTGPTGMVADSTTIRCDVYNDRGDTRTSLKVSGGSVSLIPDTAINFAREGLTVCARGATLFRQQGVDLDTGTVCAPVVVINA